MNMLHSILTKSNTNDRISNWIHNLFSERELILGNQSVIVKNGVPQGSCLSPVLFHLYTAELHQINNSETTLYQYADDFVILSSSMDEKRP